MATVCTDVHVLPECVRTDHEKTGAWSDTVTARRRRGADVSLGASTRLETMATRAGHSSVQYVPPKRLCRNNSGTASP